MELISFLILSHGILIYFIVDGAKKSSEKTKRENKIMKQVTKDMSPKEITQWWNEFYKGDI
jgi:hypothetical protein